MIVVTKKREIHNIYICKYIEVSFSFLSITLFEYNLKKLENEILNSNNMHKFVFYIFFIDIELLEHSFDKERNQIVRKLNTITC